jgi:hypothetical protein
MLGQRVARAGALAFSLLLAAPAAAQNPAGWIQSDRWACLVPLQGNDCSGGGPHVMTRSWVAPRDLATANPAAGDVWGDIDFGGAAKSAAWRGAGPPTWVNIGPGADPNVVDWNEYLSAAGLTNDFVTGIAVTYVRNTTGSPLPVGICTASDDSIVVYVNNNACTVVEACRGTALDCSEINPAVLAPGINRITVQVWEGFGGFGFRLALTRPDGSKYTSADGEVVILGADSSFGGAPALPVAHRTYNGSAYHCPSDRFTITLSGSGFDAATVYRVVEELPGCDGAARLSGISHGGTVSSLPPRAEADSLLELEEALFVGADAGDMSRALRDTKGTADPGDDEYTSISTSGGDLWANGDDFLFQYTLAGGDFDIAIEFLEKSGGNGRWGKFGLIARESLDRCSRNTFVKDHLADLQDCAGLEGRLGHLDCGGGLFGTDFFLGSSPCHPRFLRLTRRGNVFQGWGSDLPGLADGSLNPRDDCNWTPSSRLPGAVWSEPAPDELFVGFFNSEHNDNGWAVQTIRYRVLQDTPAIPLSPTGRRIVWEVSGAILNGTGVSYTIEAPRLTSVDLEGHIGPTKIQPAKTRLYFQAAGSGATGAFMGSSDIGENGPCTPGSLAYDGSKYTLRASGVDIWAGGDQFHFAYQEVSGDFQAQARFLDYSHAPAGGRWGKTGIMARWDCRPNSAYYFTHNAGASNFRCDIDGPRDAYRPHGGQNGGNGEPYQLWWQDVFDSERMDEAACTIPFPYLRANDLRGDERNLAPWLRMVRRGSTFYSYASDDGRNWTSLGSYSWPNAPRTLLVGVAMTSHAACEVQEVQFDGFSIAPTEELVTVTEPRLSLSELRRLPGTGILRQDFEDGLDGAPPPGWITHKWGGEMLTGFNPQLAGGRLRLGDLRGSPQGRGADTGTSAFLSAPLEADAAYVIDLDVFFHWTPELGAGEFGPADGLTLAMIGIGPGERRDHTEITAVGEFQRTTVGTSRGARNDTTFANGSYTTTSSTGRDIWVDGDSFEFAYKHVQGDFDMSIELIEKRFPPGGRWGKFGLMARRSLAFNSKFGMIEDHGPDLQDAARFARRVGHRRAWEMQEPATAAGFTFLDPNDGTSLFHPRYLRLTRRGGVVTGWVSNTAGSTDPEDDANWVMLYNDESWTGIDSVYLGFAYSVHNSSPANPGGGTGAIEWALVEFSGREVPAVPEPAVPYDLDLRFGDRGGGIGWSRMSQSHHAGEFVVRTRDLSLNSWSIEFDNWHGSQEENDGEGSNVTPFDPAGGELGTGTGPYHIGLNVNSSIFTAQRNHQVGVHDFDLPDIYHPGGIEVTVLYDGGRVKAWAGPGGAGDAGKMLVIDYAIEPLTVNARQALLGFTSGTGGASCRMEVDNLVVKRLGAPAARFVRSDSDSDGIIALTDAIRVLNFLFTGGVEPECMDAADADDSGSLAITDAIRILSWLFTGGLPPPAPAPSAPGYPASDCGIDPTPDGLGCRTPARKCL